MEKYWCLFACCLLLINLVNADEAAESSEIEGRTGSITLNGNNQWWAGAVYIIPILIIIVILDFAIFGTFASRADELNPVSRFFFHARNGLHLIRNKKRRQYQNLYHHHRHQRSCWHVKKKMSRNPSHLNGCDTHMQRSVSFYTFLLFRKIIKHASCIFFTTFSHFSLQG